VILAFIGSEYLPQMLADVLFGIVVQMPILVDARIPKFFKQIFFQFGRDVPDSPVS
jgi:hypothetical protein